MKPSHTIPANMLDDVRTVLRVVFGDLDSEELESVISHSLWLRMKSGDCLFKRGDVGGELFIVIHGKLSVQQELNNQKVKLKELFKGEIVGEMALISETERNADVVALRDSHLISISKQEFETLYLRHPAIGLSLSRMIIQRLQPHPKERQTRMIRNVVLYPGSNEVDTNHLINQIEVHFKNNRVLIVKDKSELRVPEKEHTQASWIRASARLANKYELIFFLADRQLTDWTEFCLGQADELLILFEAGNGGSLNIDDLFSKETLAQSSVVILHPAQSRLPSNTNELTGDLTPDNIFHIRKGNSRDFRRLMRHLNQETTGLVLAGGGARGMAHLGVWKAIKEAELEIDMIGGVSMGAFLGGVMGFDWEFEMIYDICKEISVSKPSSDYNPVPYASFIRGVNLDRILKKYYLANDIEDCWIPFYCISSDLYNLRPCVHKSGNMFKAIRASGSLPGIVPPIPVDGRWLYDGGVFNNFPVDIMVRSGIQKIIGVSFLSIEESNTLHEDIPT
ncbi:MAG: patatin-like phospholipase family protein, partial [Bacteroidia bacterium]|nr:patatin-like phospholipase family protein [Bacteroidia bacterium]